MKIFYYATLTSILRHLTLSPSKSATLRDFFAKQNGRRNLRQPFE